MDVVCRVLPRWPLRVSGHVSYHPKNCQTKFIPNPEVRNGHLWERKPPWHSVRFSPTITITVEWFVFFRRMFEKWAFLKLTPDASKSTSYFLMITSMASQLRSPKLDGWFFFIRQDLEFFGRQVALHARRKAMLSANPIFFNKRPKVSEGMSCQGGSLAFGKWWS